MPQQSVTFGDSHCHDQLKAAAAAATAPQSGICPGLPLLLLSSTVKVVTEAVRRTADEATNTERPVRTKGVEERTAR
jgi:hypothetical protein